MHRDDSGTPRVLTHPITFPSILDAAFNQLRQYGASSVAVTIRLLETISAVAAQARRADDLTALRDDVAETRAGSTATGRDRLGVEARAAAALDAIDRRVEAQGAAARSA